MGTPFGYFGPESRTRYFEEKIERGEDLSEAEYTFLKNRRLLYHVLTNAGFTNYREEWWYFDYGNQFWAKLNGTDSIYGAVYKGIDAF